MFWPPHAACEVAGCLWTGVNLVAQLWLWLFLLNALYFPPVLLLSSPLPPSFDRATDEWFSKGKL